MKEQGAVITDIRIPFGRWVIILLKCMLPAIPAMILMYAILFAIMLIFGLGLGGLAAMPTP